MKIAIGCDEAALDMKNVIKKHLEDQGHSVQDFGVDSSFPVLYADIAVAVGESVAKGENERGILMCGTGLGMAIAANKVPGIRAATCHDSFSAQRARKSNDAQIMTMGARVIGLELAKNLVDIWMDSEFQGGASAVKVAKIMEWERELHKQAN
ncbi:MAG: ribose 5-phosphate isomerase B [Spirochaetales bacterium]|nr:ribose 5-phosphate isomerase B [Spirochaetales bacterium]